MAVIEKVDGKNLITKIQVNLCWESDRIHLIVVIKNFLINLYHHSHFLAATLDLTTFFTLSIFNRATPFLQYHFFLFLQGLDDSSTVVYIEY